MTTDGTAFFRTITTGRSGDAFAFLKDSGDAWKLSHQNEPMADANKRGKITPAINFHGLRGTLGRATLL